MEIRRMERRSKFVGTRYFYFESKNRIEKSVILVLNISCKKELRDRRNRITTKPRQNDRMAKNYNIEPLFRALADKTRLRVINLIGDDEVCVCFFVEVLGSSQPKISRHLAYLRRAGLVSARREGKWMHYRIVEPADQHAARIFREVRTWLENDPAMQHDRVRLRRICCSTQVPVQLQKAPRPVSLVA